MGNSHLVANTGLQFICQELSLDASVSPLIESEKTLGYYFLSKIEQDEITGLEILKFDLLCQSGSDLVPLKELLNPPGESELVHTPSGMMIGKAGLPFIKENPNLTLYNIYQKAKSTDVFSVKSLEDLQIYPDARASEKIPAYRLLLNKWLPVPMYVLWYRKGFKMNNEDENRISDITNKRSVRLVCDK